MKNTLRTLFVPALASTLLASCGGGGGGGSPAPAPAPAPPVAVTSTNQTAVTRATLSGGLGVVRAQPFATTARAANVSPAATSTSTAALQSLIGRSVLRAAAQAGLTRTGIVRTQAITQTTDPCPAGGSVTSTSDDRDNSGGPSPGDVATLTFNQCRDTASDFANGTVTVTIGSVLSATSTRVEFSGTMTFVQFEFDLGPTRTNLDGSTAATLLDTLNETRVTLTVTSTLRFDIASPTYNDRIIYESGMRIVSDSTVTPDVSTGSLDGAFSSTSIGGRVTVATLAVFTQLGTDLYPSSGQLLITGANNSRVRATALNNTQVRLELDANGDGTFESTVIVNWSDILF